MDIFDLLFAPAEYVPVIVGAVFLALGVNMFIYSRQLEAMARPAPGKVVAIERYTSSTGSGADRETGTYYRAWIEFRYLGGIKRIYGSSANWIQHQIGDTVTVLIHQSKDGAHFLASVKEQTNVIMQLGFIAAGLLALAIASALGHSLMVIAGFTLPLLFLGLVFSSKVLEFKILAKPDCVAEFEMHKGGELFRTRVELSQEENKNAKIGAIIALVLLIAGLAILFFNLTGLPVTAFRQIAAEPSRFFGDIVAGRLPVAWQQPLALAGVGLAMAAAACLSLLTQRKQISRLLHSQRT